MGYSSWRSAHVSARGSRKTRWGERRRRKEITRLVVEAKAAYLGWREARQKIRIRGTA